MSVMVTYRMPVMGLGTDFTEFERPITFASTYTNRFRNITGGAERRPGTQTFSPTPVPGLPNLTRLHEYVDNQGNETLFSSDDFGNLWKYGQTTLTTGGIGSLDITNGGTTGGGAHLYPNEPMVRTGADADEGYIFAYVSFLTDSSGAITLIQAINIPGSLYRVGDTVQPPTTSGFASDIILTVTSLVNPVVTTTNSWSLVLSGKSDARMISAEADDKLIFVNGIDRNFYTDDGGTTFKELKALITTGTLAGGSNSTTVIDGNISNWINNTLVSNNDIVFNSTKNAYGVVVTTASAQLTITPIGSAATGAGKAATDQEAGDSYQLIDYVSLNIIPDGNGNKTDIATAASGTTASVVSVSGVDFSTTEIRSGDFIYNTTQGAIAQAGSVSANVNLLQSISAQISGDALVFFKSAMPIASWIHVHYGRCAYLDARNGHNVIFSAPDDPQDVTTFQQTLDSTSFSFGTQQPEADVLLSMETFLSYFVAAGKKNLFIYQGNTPIQDSSQTAINFTPIAFYPNGIASRFGLDTNGGDLLHMTVDGLQAINIGFNAFSVNQNNASVPILNTLRAAIATTTNNDDIQISYYPRRRWLINKIGSQCYIMNTQASYDQTGQQQQIASWHLFDGPWAQNNHYFIRQNGDLLGCGPNGMVFLLDSSAATDNGIPIATDLSTAWLRLEEPEITPRIKEGTYIRPVFESSPNIEYNISVRAGLDNFSSDSITVSAGGTGAIGSFVVGTTPVGAGSFAQAIKYPLRFRGEEFRLQFTTQSSATEDVITSFTVFGNVGGRR